MARTYTPDRFRVDAEVELRLYGAEPVALGQSAVGSLRGPCGAAWRCGLEGHAARRGVSSLAIEDNNLAVQARAENLDGANIHQSLQPK